MPIFFFLGQLTSIEQFLYEHKNVDTYVYEFTTGKLSSLLTSGKDKASFYLDSLHLRVNILSPSL